MTIGSEVKMLNVKAVLADAATGELVWDRPSSTICGGAAFSARDSVADCIVRTLAQPFGVLFVNRDGLEADARGARESPCRSEADSIAARHLRAAVQGHRTRSAWTPRGSIGVHRMHAE